jgi:hypothetical protein
MRGVPRKYRKAVVSARAFQGDTGRLPVNEACAVLAEALEREDTPDYIGLMSVEAFCRPAKHPTNGFKGHVNDLSDAQRGELVTSLRSRFKRMDQVFPPNSYRNQEAA